MMTAKHQNYTRMLSELIPEGIELPLHKDRPIEDIQADSRKVGHGDLFIAMRGQQHDARKFIGQAIDQGAVAVFAEAGLDALERMRIEARVPVIELERLEQRAGDIAATFFDDPSAQMKVVGVTGTNGKTSVSYLLAQAFSLLGQRGGVIGTLGSGPYSELQSTTHTTPDAVAFQRALFDLTQQGVTHAAVEVSSHGLDQFRLNGTHFQVAVFTNLSRDHLDYHGTMEAYAEAKEKLFHWPELKAAVINLNDPYGEKIAQGINASACELFTFSGEAQHQPRLQLRQVEADASGYRFQVEADGVTRTFRSKLIGRFNIDNLLAVIGSLRALGYDWEDCQEVVQDLLPPPGRMQRLVMPNQVQVVVDYAHTPDALEKLLQATREHCQGQLHVVFGCGGDRDAGKRPLMGRIAEGLADRVVITDDNPRSEPSQSIIDDVLSGIDARAEITVINDRTQAIKQTLMRARPGDLVVIAGKGHEDYQEIEGKRYPFSDMKVVQQTMAQLRATNEGGDGD